ncbi:hypothetical protein EUGRSUZ_H05001 [Eucalyptus grandis]|uniref:Pectate lyase superfamily protein domain-containing protein n=2 Tax=Eucalyptus grandis TaxID=71139 RepID=A0A059B901_EUCGR|nr:hypothetical protein EUGRSUZ_H05001 [Eucalyptus grandis]
MRLANGVRLRLPLFATMLFLGGVVEGRGGALTASGGLVSASSLGDRTADRVGHSDWKRRVVSVVFDVKRFGALADGRTDDRKAFEAAWNEACRSTGRVNLLIPKGTYLLGPVRFAGPCTDVSSLTGHVKASTNLSQYGSDAGWVEFGWVEGLSLTGGGVFNGQGAEAWLYNNCLNIKFISMNKTSVRGVTSVNSKSFHIALVECEGFRGSEIRISAPADSPNTDGIHIERSSGVYISKSRIRTGDDCISIGQGNSLVRITNINCGPDCNMTGTANGIRIKTWPDSPDSSNSSIATNMTFENIRMNNVTNPIIIDQTYCPFASCSFKEPSRVKLSDVHFKNIRGTSSSPLAVALECSGGFPCQDIYLQDVRLDLLDGKRDMNVTSSCKNLKAKYIGTQIPPPCA